MDDKLTCQPSPRSGNFSTPPRFFSPEDGSVEVYFLLNPCFLVILIDIFLKQKPFNSSLIFFMFYLNLDDQCLKFFLCKSLDFYKKSKLFTNAISHWWQFYFFLINRVFRGRSPRQMWFTKICDLKKSLLAGNSGSKLMIPKNNKSGFRS